MGMELTFIGQALPLLLYSPSGLLLERLATFRVRMMTGHSKELDMWRFYRLRGHTTNITSALVL